MAASTPQPMPQIASVSIEVDADAAAMWRVLADFGNPQRLAASITACRVDGEGPGAIRVVESNRGRTIHERLLRCDADTLCLQYEALPEGAMPLEALRSYRATVTLVPIAARRTRIEWTAQGEVTGPVAPVTEWCEALYEGAIRNLAASAAHRG